MTDTAQQRARAMSGLDREVERLCANVSAEQRAWLERWMFYSFPESFVANRLMVNWRLDGTDDVPDTAFWWSAAAHFYRLVTNTEPPGLVLVEPAQSPSGGPHFN